MQICAHEASAIAISRDCRPKRPEHHFRGLQALHHAARRQQAAAAARGRTRVQDLRAPWPRTVESDRPGERVIDCSLRVLREIQNIKGISTDFKDDSAGTLSIGTTHTQARYVLPPVIKEFRERYPESAVQPAAGDLRADRGNGAERAHRHRHRNRLGLAFEKFVLLPCYQWYRQVIVPRRHPLADVKKLTIEASGRASDRQLCVQLLGAFVADRRLRARRTCGRISRWRRAMRMSSRPMYGWGSAWASLRTWRSIRWTMRTWSCIDASHLFPKHTTWIGFDRSALLRKYMYDFLSLLAPHLNRRLVDKARSTANQGETDALFAAVDLPLR